VVDRFPNVEMTNPEEYVAAEIGEIDALLNILTGLLSFAVLIGLLGIVNTMTLSIHERKREIGLLRAVGMSRRQVRRMIRWETMLIAVFGSLVGLLVGAALGVTIVAGIGRGLELTVPFGTLLVYAALASLGGMVSSVWPARRGARAGVLESISHE
jgi:putative ABC transport system permease protein